MSFGSAEAVEAWLRASGLAGPRFAARVREARMSAVEQIPEERSESEKVEAWRAARLLDAGYPPDVALELALRSDVDLAQAERLLADGCPLPVAVDILR